MTSYTNALYVALGILFLCSLGGFAPSMLLHQYGLISLEMFVLIDLGISFGLFGIVCIVARVQDKQAAERACKIWNDMQGESV